MWKIGLALSGFNFVAVLLILCPQTEDRGTRATSSISIHELVHICHITCNVFSPREEVVILTNTYLGEMLLVLSWVLPLFLSGCPLVLPCHVWEKTSCTVHCLSVRAAASTHRKAKYFYYLFFLLFFFPVKPTHMMKAFFILSTNKCTEEGRKNCLW